jgi:hypothetical protein
MDAAVFFISGVRHDAADICALLGHYAASSGNPPPTFRDNVSVLSSSVKGPICCPETSVQDYHSTLRNNPEDRRSSFFITHGANWKIIRLARATCEGAVPGP